MKKASLVLILVFSMKSIGFPTEKTQLMTRLSRATSFSFGGTGFAGEITQNEKDFFIVLNGDSAIIDFEEVFRIGTPEAKCYALAGIHFLNRAKFEEMIRLFHDSKKQVQMMAGCKLFHQPIDEIIETIKKGGYTQYIDCICSRGEMI